MVIGTTLLKHSDPYFSPTFGRGGLSATFACEILLIGTSGTLDIEVQHKNVDETSFGALTSFTQFVAPGVATASASAIKEQLRFKYTVGGSQAYSFVHFNMLAPSWRPY